MPSEGVWGVLSIMPRICFRRRFRRRGIVGQLHAPRLAASPRVHLRLDHDLPPQLGRDGRAWAGVSATSPLGTGTPKSRRMALP
jgi:hypothetical protein